MTAFKSFIWISLILAVFFGCARPPLRAPTQEQSAALDTSYRQLGVRPDCSERKFDYVELLKIVNSDDVTTQQIFLSRLPTDVMQTFTLAYESESAQASAISRDFPGVIRMTQDGKLVFRYTCDRTKKVYDKIEVMRFDDADAKFKFSEIRFASPVSERVIENPRRCYGCHNQRAEVGDPRPNWTMYPEWPGFFGSHDDFFPKGLASEANLVHHGEKWLPPNRDAEKADFERFLQTKVRGADPDSCYTALPWLKGGPVPAKFVNYPFDVKPGHARERIYALRPNLKFTEVFSHLLGVRNARRIQAAPQYPDLKRLLAVEAARCLDQDYGERKITTQDLHRYLKEVLRDYKLPHAADFVAVPLRGDRLHYFDPRHPSSLAQGVYSVSIALGFAPGDWTLNFGDADNAAFETGAGPGKNTDFSGDLPVSAYVQHEILSEAVAGNVEVATLIKRSTGESDDFGPQFSCIDRIAGATYFESEEAHTQACAYLVQEALTYRQQFLNRPRSRKPIARPEKPRKLWPKPYRKGRDNLKDWM